MGLIRGLAYAIGYALGFARAAWRYGVRGYAPDPDATYACLACGWVTRRDPAERPFATRDDEAIHYRYGSIECGPIVPFDVGPGCDACQYDGLVIEQNTPNLAMFSRSRAAIKRCDQCGDGEELAYTTRISYYAGHPLLRTG